MDSDCPLALVDPASRKRYCVIGVWVGIFFSCFYVWVVVKGKTVPVYGCLLDAEGQLGMHKVPDILSVPARFHCKCCYDVHACFQHHASCIRPIT